MTRPPTLALSDAVAALRRAIERDPKRGELHYSLAAILAMEGQVEEATPHMEKARLLGVEIQPLLRWMDRHSA
jgi:Flp pilus assembly protein TadD